MFSMLKGYMEGKKNSWAIRFGYHKAKMVYILSIHLNLWYKMKVTEKRLLTVNKSTVDLKLTFPVKKNTLNLEIPH